jgi:hypothetical protein
MKVFHCDHCDHLVFFENTVCVSCEHRLAFLPEVLEVASLEPVDEDHWTSPHTGIAGRRYRLCQNYTDTLVCNWAVDADDPNLLCESCRLSRVIPDLTVAGNPEAAGIFHATDEADERVGDIVDAIARHTTTKPDVRHMPIEEARKKMGTYADALALDQIVRSGRARALGWTPTLRSVSGNVVRLLEEFRRAREAA